MGDVDLVFTEIAKRPTDTEETNFAIATLDLAVIHEVTEFDIRIQRTDGFAPS